MIAQGVYCRETLHWCSSTEDVRLDELTASLKTNVVADADLCDVAVGEV